MKLFKYVSEDRVSILENGLIRFTQPHAFNDPFELKPSIISLASPSHLAEHLKANFENIIREEYENLPNQMKIAIPFSAYSSFAESKREEILRGIQQMAIHATPLISKKMHDGFEKHIGILSLTESPNNLLMWAHYANSHQGFVIELDSAHSFFDQRKSAKDELRHLSRVTYSKHRPSVQLSSVSSFDELLVKSDDWAYEAEWRILMALNDAYKTIQGKPHDIHLFKIPFDAIRSVIIGARASTTTQDILKSAISSNPELSHVLN